MINDLRGKRIAAESDLDDFGELADRIAGALWRLARGDNAAMSSPFLREGVTALRGIAEQLKEPYFARPSIPLAGALHLSEAAGGQRELQVQREAASEFFDRLADALSEVSSASATKSAAESLAQVFATLGEASSTVYRSYESEPNDSWTSA